MRKVLMVVLSLLFTTMGFTQGGMLKPVKWSSSYEHVKGDEYKLIFHATIDDGWATYSKTSDPDGPRPTILELDKGDHYTLLGESQEIGHKKEGREPLFDNVMVGKYKHELTIEQRVNIKDYSKPITGYINYMCCNDKTCLPPTDYEFSLKVPAPTSSGASSSSSKDKKAASVATDTNKKKQEQKTEPLSGVTEQELLQQSMEKGRGTAPTSRASSTDKSGVLAPVKWSFEKEKLSDSIYLLKFIAQMEDKWAVYSQHIEGEGPVPTTFTFEEGSHYQLEGEIEEVSDHKIAGMDPNFGIYVIKYKDKVIFTQKVKVLEDTKPIKGELEFMTCDNTRCLPPDFVPFTFAFSEKAVADVQDENAKMVIVGDKIDQTREKLQKTYVQPAGNCGEEQVVRNKGAIMTFLFGFIGGLLALLTPCVFPMIPLTVSYFTKGSKDRKSGIRNGLIYGLSIIGIYISLGLLITALFGATALNDLSTNWIANVLFFLIFIFFAISFFGYYEITLPASWANKSDALADKGGYIGIFFMAFTLALVSFSCTGPIIGAALVQSATSTTGPFIVMLGFSMALALPFGLFAAFPAWLNSLPRSGGWMNTVKVVLGFLELALAFKFLSVADMTMHWGILGYEVYMIIWIVLFAAMTAYLFGWIHFPHDSKGVKISISRKVLAFATLAFTLYLASGFTYNDTTKSYNSLKALSGLAPPTSYNYFLNKQHVDPELQEVYPSYSKGPNNLNVFHDYYEGMAYAKEVHKPVLLDFTGYGCVNCRKTEEHIWTDERVRHKLSTDFVLISLYVDDKKPLEKQLWSTTQNKKLRREGDIWSDFQIANFRQNTQPLYVMVTPDEQVLAKPRGYQDGADSYNEFLECGLHTFEKVYK